ncbi:MAG: penicillin-binding transpeptidase domain-containing protein [Bdellovibrionales bacterium]
MSRRITVFFILLLGMWATLFARGLYLQVLGNEKLAKMNSKQFKTVVNIEGRRGFIFDRNGNELAASVISYSLYADPKMIKDKYTVAVRLQQKLGGKRSYYYKKIASKKKRFVWIQRRLSKAQKSEIAALKLKGIGFIEESKRVYPNQSLLAQVLGFVGSSAQGLEGLEVKFEDELSGAGKKLKVQRDARGRPLFINGKLFNESPDGFNLNLTIDRDIQYKVEKELSETVAKYSAKSATAVVLDVDTSKILAMATLPNYNPNDPFDVEASLRRNKAVTDSFEPGSTLKTITVAAALEEGIADEESKYFCENGRFKIGRRVIREADSKHKFKWLSTREILAKSSNIGTTKIAFELGSEELRNYLLNFGFGNKTSSDLPGETKGILPALPWSRHLLSNVSFGHGITATPLQIANAYAAIANGGVLNQPYIVDQVTDVRDRVVFKQKPKELRRVLTRPKSEMVKSILESVTSKEGTGFKARVPGYSTAGKTGTAQKVDHKKGGYQKGAYISSFAGFFPVDKPKIAIYVSVDDPQKIFYGSEVAAPLFSRIGHFIASKLEIPKTKIIDHNKQDDSRDDQRLVKKAKKTRSIAKVKKMQLNDKWDKMPKLEGLSMREVLSLTRKQNLDVKVYGSGKLMDTIPKVGKDLSEGHKVRLFFR